MYTVDYCDTFMDELLDKMGSNYFPLPIKLKRFESITLQFIRETTPFLEGTQELSDDISDLIVSIPRTLGTGKTYRYMGKLFYAFDLPENYFRLLNVVPLRQERGQPVLTDNFEIKLYRIGSFILNQKNPFRKGIDNRVNIYRMDGKILIESDKDFKTADLTYVRKPVFGKLPTDNMIDIKNDLVVDKLLQKTCVSLRLTSSDEDGNTMDDYVERQGQKIK